MLISQGTVGIVATSLVVLYQDAVSQRELSGGWRLGRGVLRVLRVLLGVHGCGVVFSEFDKKEALGVAKSR